MMRSFYNGISGVKSHSYGMDLLANNISNINTPGYKAAVPEFKDIFYQTKATLMGNEQQIGLAASALSSAFSQKQGFLAISDRTLDIAISGKGFFGVKDVDGQTYYTRNGSFGVDSNFNLVDDYGRFILGTMNEGFAKSTMPNGVKEMFGKDSSNTSEGYTLSDISNINIAQVNNQSPIKLPKTLFINAKATTNVDIKANLSKEVKEKTVYEEFTGDVNVEKIQNKNLISLQTEPNQKVLLEFDSQDGKQRIEVVADENGNISKSTSFDVSNLKASLVKEVKEGAINKFETSVIAADGSVQKLQVNIEYIDELNFKANAFLFNSKNEQIGQASGDLSFNPNGSLKTNSLKQINGINLNLGDENPNNEPSKGFNGLNCLDNSKIERQITTDGFAAGVLKSYAVDELGNILANFTNGKTQAVAKLALYNFINEQALTKMGENIFSASADSGAPVFLTDKDNNNFNSAKFLGNYLEQSNVDLATELTQVIIFQKAYDANSKSITTADAMLKRAIEMKK